MDKFYTKQDKTILKPRKELQGLKYNIKLYLYQLPKTSYDDARKNLPEKLGITSRTWEKWLNLEKDALQTIPVDKMYQLAKFFDIEIEDLLNYEPVEINIENTLEAMGLVQ
jgi:hypothetical protein